MQSGPGLQAGVAVVGVGPVAQSAVGVTGQTLPVLFVLEEPPGTVEHADALVEEAILLTACTERTAFQHRRLEDDSAQLRQITLSTPEVLGEAEGGRKDS